LALVVADVATRFAGAAPVIVTQPQNQAVPDGTSEVTFSVVANDSLPLGYQWQFDGANLLGATRSSLNIMPASLDMAGAYTVTVADSNTSTNSQEAYLDVYTNRASPLSEQLALEHLRQEMDLYHDRVLVYDDIGSGGNHFVAQGQLPDGNSLVTMDTSSTNQPHSGATAIRCAFQAAGDNWGGFYLMNGLLVSNVAVPYFGDAVIPGTSTPVTKSSGFDLSGADTLTFWLRGEQGDEEIQVFMGGVGRDATSGVPTSPFPDSTPRCPKVGTIFKATKDWKKHTISLAGLNLANIMGGLGWVADSQHNPAGAVFYLDDIQYNLTPAALTRRLDQPRFIRSYLTRPFQPGTPEENSVSNFDYDLRDTAFTYDNAVAILAFLADGSADSLRRARLIGDAFLYATSHDRTYTDGRVRSAYASGDIVLAPGWIANGKADTVPIPGFYDVSSNAFYEVGNQDIDTGDNAWTMLALEALYQKTRDSNYLNGALAIGNFITHNFWSDTGTYQGFLGGISFAETPTNTLRTYASTEHNLDIFAAFRQMSDLSGDSTWTDGAEHAQIFVEQMWDGTNYLAGTTSPDVRNDLPGQLPLDTQSWNILSRTNVLALHPQILANAESLFGCTSDGFTGYDFNDDWAGVWFEGVGQMCVAYAVASEGSKARTLANTLCDAQQIPAPVGDSMGMVAASHNGLATGFSTDYGSNYYYCRLHLGATAWNIFAQLGFNPFYQTSVVEQGVYNGLFYCSTGITEETAGMLYDLKVGSKGTFTGKLLIGGESYPLRGGFDAFGNASNQIPRSTKLGGPLMLQMTLNCAATPPVLTGTVCGTNGGSWTADLVASPASNSPSSEYTILMPPVTNGIGVSTPGYGYILMTNHSGTVTLSASLADGTPFNQTTSTDQSGVLPLYGNLYGNTGLFLGWLNIASNPPVGQATWIRKPSKSALYPKGFTNNVWIVGSIWTKPQAHTTPFPMAFNLSIAGGNLISNLTYTVIWESNNTLRTLEPPAGPSTNSLAGTLNPKTGFFQFKFGNENRKGTTTGTGVFLQDVPSGGGHFLGTTNDGSISLQTTEP